MKCSYQATTFNRFWNHHPCLLYALAALLGFYTAQFWSYWLFIPFISLVWPFLNPHALSRLLLSLAVMMAMFCYAKTTYRFPSLPSQGIEGTVHLSISSLSTIQTHFGNQWLYRGKALLFIPDNSEYKNFFGKNLPCRIKLAKNHKIVRPPADCSYLIHGTLKEAGKGSYTFTTHKETPWYPVKGSRSLAEWRYRLKERIKHFIVNSIPSSRSAELLCGMITGEFKDRLMRAEFEKVGLQHLMAISGFHFAIFAGLLNTFLRLVLPWKISAIILSFLLTGYFIFLGSSPSIVRAWVMSSLVLGGFIVQKQSVGLNSLGVALLAILIVDPSLSLNIGFFLSVGTTASILLWYPVMTTFLGRFFLKQRRLEEVMHMNFFDQHCYLILSAFRGCLALAIAVYLTALPMTLYFFAKFPLLSFLYNLFIPFLVSFSMLLFLCGAFFSIVFPFLGTLVHHANAGFTDFLLNFIYHLPTTVQYTWRVSTFPAPLLIAYLCFLFTLGIRVEKNYFDKREIFC